MIRIPIPPDLPLKDYLRLRTHADWYLRHGARVGAAAANPVPAARRSDRLAPARAATAAVLCG